MGLTGKALEAMGTLAFPSRQAGRHWVDRSTEWHDLICILTRSVMEAKGPLQRFSNSPGERRREPGPRCPERRHWVCFELRASGVCQQLGIGI